MLNLVEEHGDKEIGYYKFDRVFDSAMSEKYPDYKQSFSIKAVDGVILTRALPSADSEVESSSSKSKEPAAPKCDAQYLSELMSKIGRLYLPPKEAKSANASVKVKLHRDGSLTDVMDLMDVNLRKPAVQ